MKTARLARFSLRSPGVPLGAALPAESIARPAASFRALRPFVTMKRIRPIPAKLHARHIEEDARTLPHSDGRKAPRRSCPDGTQGRVSKHAYFKLKRRVTAQTTAQTVIRKELQTCKLHKRLVGLGRLELPTSPLSGVRSNHLSYRPTQINAPCFAKHHSGPPRKGSSKDPLQTSVLDKNQEKRDSSSLRSSE